MQIIGVAGFRRCGKNATTQILAEKFGFKQYAFADPLRSMCAAVNPIISVAGAPHAVIDLLWRDLVVTNHEFLYTELLEKLGYELAKDIPDFRRFLQKMGTEGVRNTFGPRAWVDALARRIDTDSPEKVTISDVRFHSEADWVHSRGGLLWRIVRPGHGGDDSHPSEVEIPNLPADREIIATSLDELQRAVIEAFNFDVTRFPSTSPINANRSDTPAA